MTITIAIRFALFAVAIFIAVLALSDKPWKTKPPVVDYYITAGGGGSFVDGDLLGAGAGGGIQIWPDSRYPSVTEGLPGDPYIYTGGGGAQSMTEEEMKAYRSGFPRFTNRVLTPEEMKRFSTSERK